MCFSVALGWSLGRQHGLDSAHGESEESCISSAKPEVLKTLLEQLEQTKIHLYGDHLPPLKRELYLPFLVVPSINDRIICLLCQNRGMNCSPYLVPTVHTTSLVCLALRPPPLCSAFRQLLQYHPDQTVGGKQRPKQGSFETGKRLRSRPNTPTPAHRCVR